MALTLKMPYLQTTNMLMYSFFFFLTISYNIMLPDMDYMPRMIALSVFLLFFTILIFMILKKNQYLIESKALYNVTIVSFGLLIIILLIASQNSLLPNDALFDLLKFTMMFLYLIIFSIIFYFHPDGLTTLSRCIIAPLFFVILIALWQFFYIFTESTNNETQMEIGNSISSLLSNKNSLAEFLLLGIPFALYSFLKEKKFLKLISGINILASVFLLFKLNSFSVNISFIFSLLAVAILWVLKSKRHIQEKFKISKQKFYGILSITAITVVTTSFFAISKIDGFKKANLIIHYLTGAGTSEEFNENSVYERLLLWKNSIKMINAEPILGVGTGNWKLLFPSFGYGGAKYLTTDSVKFTRAHNDYLQLFSESGIGALIVFVMFIISAIYYAGKIYFATGKLKSFVLLWAVTGYAIVALFGFPTEKVFLLAMLVITVSLITGAYAKSHFAERRSIKTGTFIFTLIALCTGFFSVKVCMARMNEESNFKQLLNAKESGNWARMYAISKKTTTRYFPLDYTATPVSWYIATAAYMNGQTKEAMDNYKIALAQAPYHVQVHNDIGAVHLNNGNYSEAEQYFNNALKINPRFPDALFNKAVAVFNKGNKYGAYKLFRKVSYIHKPPKYDDYMLTVVNAVADSVFKSRNLNMNKPVKKEDIRGRSYVSQIEARAWAKKIDFLDELEKEITDYNNQ